MFDRISKTFLLYSLHYVKLLGNTAQKMKIVIKDFAEAADLITFTEKILNGELLFLCSVNPCS